VQWVPEQRVCVVRYIPPTPVPTPPPTPPPTPLPSPTPTATPKITGWVQGGYTQGKVSNEFTNGNVTSNGIVASGAWLFNPLALKLDWRQDIYSTANNFVPTPTPAPTTTAGSLSRHLLQTTFNTIDGGSATVPEFIARQSTLDARLEFRLFKPWYNIAVGYLQAATNYGYPIVYGPGFGLEKFQDLGPGQLSWYGSAFYYPHVQGVYTVQTGPSAGLNKTIAYEIYKYDLGLDYVFGTSPFFVTGGFSGDHYQALQAAPGNETHAGPYVELGFKF
jgi:hypothetical protein